MPQLLCLSLQILYDGGLWRSVWSVADDFCSALKADVDANGPILLGDDCGHHHGYEEGGEQMQGIGRMHFIQWTSLSLSLFIESSRNFVFLVDILGLNVDWL